MLEADKQFENMNDVTQGHTVHAFNDELAGLRGLVLEMGELVVEQVSNSVKALCEEDVDLGHRVVEQDRQVDQYDMRVDEEIFRVLALRQPLAGDLRLVLALSKVSGELAQAGNKAKKIARFASRIVEDDARKPRRRLMRDIRRMQDRACCMLESSMDAIAKLDMTTAVDIVKRDEELDEDFDAALRYLVTFVLEDASCIAAVLDMVFILKALERVGDHANHIAEQVIFVAEGRDVRYLSTDVLEQDYAE
jgi:phosphate transport system protein